MDDDNIDNEENQEIWEEAQAEVEQERIAAARTRRLQLITVLLGFDEIPFQTRHKTDELVEEFLENLEDDIYDMLCDNDIAADNYCGLDSDRDTEEEVETVIRFFPEVLSRRKEDGDGNFYPIQLISFTHHWGCNVKAVSFIPIVARIAIDFGLFEEQYRGGLLCQDEVECKTVLENLTDWRYLSDRRNVTFNHEVDDKYLQVLIRLRKMGLLNKEDIQEYNLLNQLCTEEYIAEKRFRFLAEWDPTALAQIDVIIGCLPLHHAACNNNYSIRGFQLVFEYGIRYFPKKKGINLLFRKKNNGVTPFQYACERLGCEKVMKIIEDTIFRYSSSSSSDDTPSLNIVEALMTAAIDKDIHLDCVYFLLRRQPDILQKLLSSNSKKRNRKDTNSNDDSSTLKE
ncbi:MAG: hypothetical protein ACI8RD_001823 [Bacillariaceae sp.]|jgi:hypothetical protein